jgi:hypothetical protein
MDEGPFRMKTIRSKSVDLKSLKLSPEEGFVLSRIDGTTTVKELIALTGLEEARVVDIVGRLSTEGAVEVSSPAASQASVPVPAVVNEALRAFLEESEPEPEPEPESNTDPEREGEATEEAPSDAPDAPPDASDVALDELDAEETKNEQANERAHRQIYETVYRPMERDARVQAALEVSGDALLALCLDPEPQVVHAILDNPKAGVHHARAIALYHRTQVGLEAVAKRTEYLKDPLVQRRLVRNPQLPNVILNRIVNPKMMIEVYKLAIDREIPERSRGMAREILRKKFMIASSDEKAALLLKTEGRCLVLLVSCGLDAHATQILCGKTSFTILFIQNLARWSATPPALLTHLLKMQVVRRNVGLKKMILKHPNVPSEAKRLA